MKVKYTARKSTAAADRCAASKRKRFQEEESEKKSSKIIKMSAAEKQEAEVDETDEEVSLVGKEAPRDDEQEGAKDAKQKVPEPKADDDQVNSYWGVWGDWGEQANIKPRRETLEEIIDRLDSRLEDAQGFIFETKNTLQEIGKLADKLRERLI